MELTESQYERIKDALPVHRGNVSLSNLQVLNAVLYVAEQGCMAWSSEALWPLAHDLYADEPLVQGWRPGPGVREVAGRADRPHQARSRVSGFDLDQGSSRRHRGSKKTGRSPSARAGADGTPRCIWLPRMLERP